jgi:hypothetical protein
MYKCALFFSTRLVASRYNDNAFRVAISRVLRGRSALLYEEAGSTQYAHADSQGQ